MTVFVTSGGTRFHADRECRALTDGRNLFGWLCSDSGPVYPVAAVPVEALAHSRYTACRVCVPPALALPPTGQTFGHEPVHGTGWYGRGEVVCARCTEPSPPWAARQRRTISVHWPCASAVVLGLVPRDGVA